MKQIRSLRALGALTLALSLILALQVTAAQRTRSSLPEVVDPPFLFDSALPEADPVSLDWFQDAVFIGGSQTEYLMSYQPLQAGLWLTGNDFDVTSVAQKTFQVGGKHLLFADALRGSGCTKIYLMLGAGQAGNDDNAFRQAYGDLIDVMRQAIPGAQIYLQTFLPVTAKWAASTGFDNESFRHRNYLLLQVARDKQVYLVDVAAAFLTPDGALPEQLSTDGLYLTTEGHHMWVEYLQTHAMRT